MRLKNHFHEIPPGLLKKLLQKYDNLNHKIYVWNAFADSGLSGINDDDCAILPRIFPYWYFPVIRRAAYNITLFALRLLSLPEKEIRAIIPPAPVRDFLIEELAVLRFRTQRLTGCFRFDMAVVGLPEKHNPPKLLEINEIGFDGLARSSFIQETILNLIPGLRKKVIAFDTASAEARNMRRLGRNFVRFQYDSYNWEEEVLIKKAREHGVNIDLISPEVFKCNISKDDNLLLQKPVCMKKGYVKIGLNRMPSACQMGYSFELKDYKEGAEFFRSLVRAKTPQYQPFLTGLVGSKIILVLLSDPHLRRKLLGSAKKLETVILPSFSFHGNENETRRRHDQLVLKYTDGLGGEKVFIGHNMLPMLFRIKKKERGHWILQERAHLNTINVNGILSRPRRAISDLGVFIQYDWAGGKFRNFETGGFISRATNRSLKVNVSGGGIQVPVMFSLK